jgi:hypothetical protein
MLNPLNIVFAILGRFVRWTTPGPSPLPDEEGRQGLEVSRAK